MTSRWLNDIFLHRLRLSIRYLPIFFLVGQSSSVKISLVALSSFLVKKAVITI